MKRMWSAALLAGFFFVGAHVSAGSLPQRAVLSKDLGDSYLSSRQYGEAMDAYLGALEYYPPYPDDQYNLRALYLKGFRRYDLAAHHFEQYLVLRRNAKDHARVSVLVESLKQRAIEKAGEEEPSHLVIGRRLLVRRPENLAPGQDLTVSIEGLEESVSLRVSVSYPGWILTSPIPEGGLSEGFLLQSDALALGR